MKICGIDEAGRGPLAGPVVVAAVIMNNNKINGIRDSKKLSPKIREELYQLIVDNSLFYKTSVIDNNDIDSSNILKCCMTGIENCILGLDKNKIKFLIDGNYFKLNYDKHKDYNYETIVKGDDKIYEISCASIIAKVTRDRIMFNYDKIYPDYNFKNNKGYGTKEHINKIKEIGICDLHRKTFLNKIFNQTQISFD